MTKLKTAYTSKVKSEVLNTASDANYKSIQLLTQALIEKNSIQEVAEVIVQKAIFNLGFEDCSFYLVEKKQLKLLSFRTNNLEFKEFLANSKELLCDCGLLDKVAKNGKALITKNYTPERNCKFGTICFNSQISVPIVYEKKIIGILDSKHVLTDYFTDTHLETLQTIASIASIKIVQLKKNFELELYKKELEKLVTKRTKDLETTLSELKLKNLEINRKNSSLNILLQEVHHRVANNLQIILSLIRIKYMVSNNTLKPNQFKDLENRILSMALIHQNIMTKGFISKEDFGSYVSDLVRHIQRSHNFERSINVVKKIDSFSIQPNNIFYLGLIITEIVANSINYAFDSTEIPVIKLSIYKDTYHNILEIEDNGSGFNPNLWKQSEPASGFDVIKILAEQIDGEITCFSEGKTKFELTIPFS